jgi:hypothetical protein
VSVGCVPGGMLSVYQVEVLSVYECVQGGMLIVYLWSLLSDHGWYDMKYDGVS